MVVVSITSNIRKENFRKSDSVGRQDRRAPSGDLSKLPYQLRHRTQERRWAVALDIGLVGVAQAKDEVLGGTEVDV